MVFKWNKTEKILETISTQSPLTCFFSTADEGETFSCTVLYSDGNMAVFTDTEYLYIIYMLMLHMWPDLIGKISVLVENTVIQHWNHGNLDW